MSRVKHISRIEKFAKGVREIVWETAHYHHMGSEYDLDFDFTMMLRFSGIHRWQDMRSCIDEAGAISVARLNQLSDEEDTACTTGWESLLATLRDAFKTMTGMKTVNITSWDSDENGERRFFDRYTFAHCHHERVR